MVPFRKPGIPIRCEQEYSLIFKRVGIIGMIANETIRRFRIKRTIGIIPVHIPKRK